MKRDFAGLQTILALTLLIVLAPAAAGATVAELRERLLAPETPEGERSHIVSRLLATGREGENVLRAVLLEKDEAVVRPVVRGVLVQTHEPLLVEVLAHALPRDLQECRSPRLIRALAGLASKAESDSAGQALLALESAAGRDAVEALMDLWEADVSGARDAFRRILPKAFPSVGEARAWWAGQSGKSYEAILLEICVELARPSADAEDLHERYGKLRKAHIAFARAGLATARPTQVAGLYLSSDIVEIRRLGADHLKGIAPIPDEQRSAFSAGLLLALGRTDEETATLVALLGAARVHVAGLRALEPKGRACDTVLGLRDRTERAVRLEWIDLLGELGDGRASKDLEGLYEGADSAVRGRVIDALLSIGNGVVPWARAALDRQLGRGPELDVDVTGKLVNLLGRRGGSADVAILARVLRDVTDRTPEDVESPKIRRFAAEALGTAGVKRNSTAAIQALIETGLRDPSSGVRQKSAAALADATGSPAALAGLEGLLRDDDKDTAREAAAESLLTLLGAEAGPRLAPHVGQDEKLMEILDRAVKKALAETKIIALRETVENLISVDPDRTVEMCKRIGAASWPPATSGELSRVSLVHARAACLTGHAEEALAILEAIPAGASVPGAERCVVRAQALRIAGRPAEAVRAIDAFVKANPPADAETIRLGLEKITALIAVPRLDEALAAHGALSERTDLSVTDRADLAALAKAIEQARTGGGAAVDNVVDAWLEGTGGEGALARVKDLGVRAYPILLARLNALGNGAALGGFLAKLRDLTGKDFGYAKAETPAERKAVRARWVGLLSGK